MLKLIKKEFLLAMHPIAPMVPLFSLMTIIPNYPYIVIFFYAALAIFFTCLSGRENNDIIYSLNLPIAKKSIVAARILFAVILEMLQLVFMIPFVIISQKINPIGNQAGMDANIALFGIAFIVYGIFNFAFFKSYYKNVTKVGTSFLKSGVLLFLLAALDAVSSYTVPLVKNVLDTPDSQNVLPKIIFLLVGLFIYIVLTGVVCKISFKNFENQDLQ